MNLNTLICLIWYLDKVKNCNIKILQGNVKKLLY